MNATIKSTKLRGIAIALVAAAAIWFGWPSSRVLAIEDPENTPAPFGLARGQTARLNILNSGEERGYNIDWKFLDTMGRIVAEGPQPHLVTSRQFLSFDVDGDSLDVMRDRLGRVQLRAVVTAVGNPDTKNLRLSLEVLDNDTGKTSFVITPPPEPD
jgi:hypothetical protein